jgi:hypothetical protein
MKIIQNLRAVVDSQLHVRLSVRVFQYKSTGLCLVFHVGCVAQGMSVSFFSAFNKDFQ